MSDIKTFIRRRTPQEIRIEVERSLKDKPKWCDAWHAEHCSVVEKIVSNTRQMLGIPKIERQYLKQRGGIRFPGTYMKGDKSDLKTKEDKRLACPKMIADVLFALKAHPNKTIKDIAKITNLNVNMLHRVSTVVQAGLEKKIGKVPLSRLVEQSKTKRKKHKNNSRRHRSDVQTVQKWVDIIIQNKDTYPVAHICREYNIPRGQAGFIDLLIKNNRIDSVLTGKMSLATAYREMLAQQRNKQH